MHEKSTFVEVEYNINEKINALVTEGETLVNAVEMVNNTTKAHATSVIFEGAKINWEKLIYGVFYPVATLEDGKLVEDTEVKRLSVNDCFILKANKKSTKTVVPSKILTLVRLFGVNLVSNKYTILEDETLANLVIHKKYNIVGAQYDCFTCETANSVNQLEKQFAILLEYFFGKDNAPKARKTYVKHLREMYVKAINDGYRNGNEINLLQLIINHAYDNAIGKEYIVKSGLDAHRAPKENK